MKLYILFTMQNVFNSFNNNVLGLYCMLETIPSFGDTEMSKTLRHPSALKELVEMGTMVEERHVVDAWSNGCQLNELG